ncbi:MAG: hypothetical protein CVV55_07710, partial [Synergistetes bacterium HGW-Synergistetes-2]
MRTGNIRVWPSWRVRICTRCGRSRGKRCISSSSRRGRRTTSTSSTARTLWACVPASAHGGTSTARPA